MVRLLLSHGASTDPSDLAVAASVGDIENVALLLANIKDVSPKLLLKALSRAVQMGHVEPVQLLVKNGAEVNGGDSDRVTPLMWAAMMHRTEMVKVLLENGADPSLVDKFGYTTLRHTKDIDYLDPRTAELLNEAVMPTDVSIQTGAVLR